MIQKINSKDTLKVAMELINDNFQQLAKDIKEIEVGSVPSNLSDFKNDVGFITKQSLSAIKISDINGLSERLDILTKSVSDLNSSINSSFNNINEMIMNLNKTISNQGDVIAKQQNK